MSDPNSTLCFTGHRSLPCGQPLESLKTRLLEEIDHAITEGYTTFLFGGAMGFDLLAAEAVLYRKKQIHFPSPKPLALVAVLPFEEQANRYSQADRKRYFDEILPHCDEVITLSTRYHDNCFKIRNRYLVEHSSKVIAYYDGTFRTGTAQTVRMAQLLHLPIINLYK